MSDMVVSFCKGAFAAARNDAKASAYLAHWTEAASDQPWWRGETEGVSPAARLTAILVAAHPFYKEAQAKPRAPKVPRDKAPRAATPKPQKAFKGVVGGESKGFDAAWDAHKWVVRMLAEAPLGTKGQVVDCLNPHLSVSVDQARATRIVNRVDPGTATRTVGGKGGSGPWMKASQDRARFSKG